MAPQADPSPDERTPTAARVMTFSGELGPSGSSAETRSGSRRARGRSAGVGLLVPRPDHSDRTGEKDRSYSQECVPEVLLSVSETAASFTRVRTKSSYPISAP